MKIIVGLGNPGKRYESTRHNAGFMAVDALQSSWKFRVWKIDKKSNSAVSSGTLDGEKVYLLKPQNFMNASGETVSKFVSYHKTLPKDILVIHDELDLPLGDVRLIFNRGSAGHKGVQSIIDKLGTKNFSRIRIGVAQKKTEKIEADKFVLGHFIKEEKKILQTAVSEMVKQAEKFITEK